MKAPICVAAAASVAVAAWLWKRRGARAACSACAEEAPKVIQVYGIMPLGSDPDISAPVAKLITFLRLAGVDFEYHAMGSYDSGMAPKGKVPFARGGALGATPMGDSQLIMEALVAAGVGADLDAWLTEEQRAVGTAVRVMLEESVYWGVVSARWANEEVWTKTVPLVFDFIRPALLRTFIARSVRTSIMRALYAQGHGRHSDEELTAMICKQIDAAVTLLGSKKYLFSDTRMCTVDCTLFAFVSGLLQGEWTHPITAHARACPTLVAYRARVAARLFPERQQQQ